jgi:hypothetical protein
MIAVGDIARAQATFMGYADCFGLQGVILLRAVDAVAMLKKGIVAAGGAR